MDPENVKTFAKKIRKRLDSQKFKNYLESLNSEENKADQTNIDQTLPKNVDETESQVVDDSSGFKFLAKLQIKKNQLFDEENCLKISRREWTQNLYENLSNIVQCSLVVKFKSLLPEFKIHLHCRHKLCKVSYRMICCN